MVGVGRMTTARGSIGVRVLFFSFSTSFMTGCITSGRIGIFTVEFGALHH